MKFVDSVKQADGPGGTLETWLLANGVYLCCWKNLDTYEMYFRNNNGIYTKSIFDYLIKKYHVINMEYGGFFPPKITMQHKYFDRFVSIVENLDLEDLTPDPFEG